MRLPLRARGLFASPSGFRVPGPKAPFIRAGSQWPAVVEQRLDAAEVPLERRKVPRAGIPMFAFRKIANAWPS